MIFIKPYELLLYNKTLNFLVDSTQNDRLTAIVDFCQNGDCFPC